MKNRILVTFDLELTLSLTRSQARRARSDAFKARLRSALAYSTAMEALAEALDVDPVPEPEARDPSFRG